MLSFSFRRLTSPVGRVARQEVEHRHSYRDAVGYLGQDHAVRAVGDVAVDLDPPVHRARVHDDEVLRRAVEPLLGHAEDAIVFPERRHEASLHPLELKSKDVESVGPLNRVFDPVHDGDAERFEPDREQARRPAHRDLGSKLQQAPNIAPRYAAMFADS